MEPVDVEFASKCFLCLRVDVFAVAAELGELEKVKSMLNTGISLSSDALTYGLGMASRNGHFSIVELLLKVRSLTSYSFLTTKRILLVTQLQLRTTLCVGLLEMVLQTL